MAKAQLNPALGSIRGKIDGWVYRQHNDQTIVSPHRPRKKDQPSRAQRAGRVRFQDAQAYAAEVLADPLKREVYRKLGAERKRPPNVLLISNFLTPPTIEQIDLSGYTGKRGQPIRVLASDAIEVATVTLTIRNAAGETLETGPATSDHGVWTYRSTMAAPGPWEIETTVQNRAGASATKAELKR